MRFLGALIGVFIMKSWLGLFIGYFIGLFIEKNFTFSNKNLSTSSGKFELNLLGLAAILIKSDGEVSQNELDYVRSNTIFKIFNENVNKQKISYLEICNFFLTSSNYATRLQLIHFLFSVAKADGMVSNNELLKLKEFSNLFKISLADFDSIKAMFVDQIGSAYKILEVTSDATNNEIKKSYRRLVKIHHPDKIQNLNDGYKKIAKEKFQKIQDAYEKIKKERSIK
jgi:DnaJ like chaperone protein